MATTVLTRLGDLREGVVRRRALRRELDSYTTEGALDDIEAAIARSGAEAHPEARELRRIVAAKRSAIMLSRH